MRSDPPQASTPSGSYNRIIRPDADSSSLPAGYKVADSAWLNGANRAGAGSGPISISLRTRATSSRATARRNSAGPTAVGDAVMVPTLRPGTDRAPHTTPQHPPDRPGRTGSGPSPGQVRVGTGCRPPAVAR